MLFRLLPGGAPHFVREYRNLVRFLERSAGADAATDAEVASQAIGGHYEAIGAIQAAMVMEAAPAEGPFLLVDVGCGSGRAANALKDVERCAYLGTDVVPALLDYARSTTGRPDWRFETVTSLAIPCADGAADVVMFMSVFTHLKPREVKASLREAARVLRPGGVLLCSYLDRDNPDHVAAYQAAWRRRLTRFLGLEVMISFTREAEISGWLGEAGFAVERSLTENPLGQHVLVGRKTAG